MQTERVLKYFNERADAYLSRSQKGLWEIFRQREYAAVARLLALKPGHQVLDGGCGAGYYALRLRAEFGAEVTGVDISQKMIAQLSAHGILGHVGNVVDFDGAERFDRVLLAGMLEFVPDVEAVFRSAFRALKPGGRLVALLPKAGLSGWAYAKTHEWSGCPTRVLSLSSYQHRAAHVGLQFVESVASTPISLAASWVK